MTETTRCRRLARLAACWLAVLCLAGSAEATTLPFDDVSGFDNDLPNLMLPAKYVIPSASDWKPAGAGSVPGGIQFTETFCLKELDTDPCTSFVNLGVGPYFADVTWNPVNTSGMAGPALLFISGLSADPPYAPASVGIVLESATIGGQSVGFDVVQYTAGGVDYFYAAFLVDDFSQELTFRYEVDAKQMLGGTPELQANAAFNFVPEPASGLLAGLGLVGLGVLGRRRKS